MTDPYVTSEYAIDGIGSSPQPTGGEGGQRNDGGDGGRNSNQSDGDASSTGKGGTEPPVQTGGRGGSGGGGLAAGGGGGAGGGGAGTLSSDPANGGRAGANGSSDAGGPLADALTRPNAALSNLIENSGFETGTLSGWRVLDGGASLNVTSTMAHSGARALVIWGRQQSYQGPSYSLTGLAAPGRQYRVQCWVKLPEGVPASDGFIVTMRTTCDANRYQYSRWVEGVRVSSTSWSDLSGTGKGVLPCPSGTPLAVDLYVEAPVAVPSFYVDDVVVELM